MGIGGMKHSGDTGNEVGIHPRYIHTLIQMMGKFRADNTSSLV